MTTPSILRRPAVLLALLASGPALAGLTVTGDTVEIHYNDDGAWNWSEESAGLTCDFDDDGDYERITYPGTPYVGFALEFTYDDDDYHYYVDTAYGYAEIDTEWGEDVSTDDVAGSEYTWTAEPLSVVREETWAVDDTVVLVTWTITNDGDIDVEDLRVMLAADPDQDNDDYGTTNTYIDTVDSDDDKLDDWIEAVGPSSGWSVGFGACEPDRTELGAYASYYAGYDADITIADYDGSSVDYAIVWRWNADGAIEAGETIVTSMVVVMDETQEGAQEKWADSMDLCLDCDSDEDGYDSLVCDGTDCDDLDAGTYPGAEDTWYDGVDSDCDGANDYDADADGYETDEYGGDDCDDTDDGIFPGAEDTWYDGVDTDCSGGSDYDADGDGQDSDAYGGTDCDDADAGIYVGAEDTWYDGVDTDCSGGSDYDADGDGDDSAGYGGGDCDETDPEISSLADEVWYDGVDQDCSGGSDYDADGDGQDSAEYEGEDCDDSDPDAYVGADEVWYDGVDQDCAGGDDYDADGDGYASDEHGGEDCDDTDADVWDDCGGDDGGTDSGGTDGGTDSGTDSGGTDDGGSDDGADDDGTDDDKISGCGGCATGSTSGSGFGLAALGLFAMVGLRRRR